MQAMHCNGAPPAARRAPLQECGHGPASARAALWAAQPSRHGAALTYGARSPAPQSTSFAAMPLEKLTTEVSCPTWQDRAPPKLLSWGSIVTLGSRLSQRHFSVTVPWQKKAMAAQLAAR